MKPSSNQYISNIFLVPKSDGSQRLILNLKPLNCFLRTTHFKLEDQRVVANILQSNMFMATLDLKDAYFQISIHENHRKYLRFKYKGITYQYNCMPFGLNCAPLVFTKLMKPVIAFLREKGFLSVVYLDDFLLMGKNFVDCQENVAFTIKILESLGFIINYKKSVLIPSKICKFLGFIYNSENMSISIPDNKKEQLIKFINSIIYTEKCKIRQFARLIGKLISVCPAVQYGWLYTKMLERQKYLALQKCSLDYNQTIEISSEICRDLRWWLNKIPTATNSIRVDYFHLEIYSDASLTGWGVVCGNERSHGFWSPSESTKPINFLELKAAFFGLKCFANILRRCNVLLRIDNTTAISFINRMGGIQYKKLNTLCRHIWQWCEQRDLFIFASYINSKDNKDADEESRQTRLETEWELNSFYFNEIVAVFGMPEIDIFASRINTKCEKFVSWYKDPDAVACDAFTIGWQALRFYAFPPFAIILRVLQKIVNDNAQGVVIVPYWPTQPWFPIFMSLLVKPPIFFKPNKSLLFSIDRESPHPLWPQLTLVAGLLSKKRSN